MDSGFSENRLLPEEIRNAAQVALNKRREKVFHDPVRQGVFLRGVQGAWNRYRRSAPEEYTALGIQVFQLENIEKKSERLINQLGKIDQGMLDSIVDHSLMSEHAFIKYSKIQDLDDLHHALNLLRVGASNFADALQAERRQGRHLPGELKEFVRELATSWHHAFDKKASASPGGSFAGVLNDTLTAMNVREIKKDGLEGILK